MFHALNQWQAQEFEEGAKVENLSLPSVDMRSLGIRVAFSAGKENNPGKICNYISIFITT